MKEYSEKYDAMYDSVKDVWLEKQCSAEECEYCTTRPEKPSQVENHSYE